MPNGFGFDGDTAYYESLAQKIRADEAAKVAAADSAERERRSSLGLPPEEPKQRRRSSLFASWTGKKNTPKGEGVRSKEDKKSAGEIIATMAFGNRSSMGAPRDEKWKSERDGKA